MMQQVTSGMGAMIGVVALTAWYVTMSMINEIKYQVQRVRVRRRNK